MSRAALPVMAFLSFAVALVSWRFLIISPETLIPSLTLPLWTPRLAIWTHIFTAPLALAAGAVQFFPRLRAARPRLHRWTGRAYGIAVGLAGLSALGMTASAWPDRPIAATGFTLLALLWLATTARAIAAAMARPRQLALHQDMMTRSFALTFAAVTLRLQLPLFIGFGHLDYAQASLYVAWLCWVPNLIVAEWIIRRRRAGSAPLTPAAAA